MTEIKRINELRYIEIVAKPGWKDSFSNNPLVQNANIPHVFFSGEKWRLNHDCLKCKNRIDVSIYDNTIKLIGYLSLNNFKSKTFINSIGSILGLKLDAYVDENNFEVYSFKLTKFFPRTANAFRYLCPHCNAHYLGALSFVEGDSDRKPEPDKVYIESIVMVDFDEVEFERESSC